MPAKVHAPRGKVIAFAEPAAEGPGSPLKRLGTVLKKVGLPALASSSHCCLALPDCLPAAPKVVLNSMLLSLRLLRYLPE